MDASIFLYFQSGGRGTDLGVSNLVYTYYSKGMGKYYATLLRKLCRRRPHIRMDVSRSL